MLTIDQLKQGKIYITSKPNPGYVFLCVGDCKRTSFLNINGIQFGTNGWLSSDGNDSFKYYEEASYENAEWLKACIAVGEIVEKPKITLQYSIY